MKGLDWNSCRRALFTGAKVGEGARKLLLLLLLVGLPFYASTLPARAMPALHDGWSQSNGTLTEGGKPIFPLGVYYVSHFPNQKQRRLKDLPIIAAGGLRVLHTPVDRHDGPLLDACQRLGIEVIAEFNDDLEILVQRFGKHPALRAWSTFDDVDAQRKLLKTARYTSLEVLRRTESLHASSPGLLTYISGGYPARLPNYAQSADLIGLQMYPIPDESSSTVGKSLKTFWRKTGTAAPVVIANLQLFGWHGKKRPPDKAELRNMTYQALIGGVKGILYYTFFDTVTDLRKQPSLWNDLTGVIKELQELQEFILNGKHCILQSSDADAFAALWRLPHEILFIAANGSNNAATVKFSGCLPGGTDSDGKARVIATGGQSSIQVEMQPMEVVIQRH